MKTKTLFVCQNCGAQSPAWLGKCPACSEWNTFIEENTSYDLPGSRGGIAAATSREEPVLLSDILDKNENRIRTTIEEFDGVLGGGIVPGSVTLIGGDPGIGKSTLSLQAGCLLGSSGHKVLYVSGEESVQQTRMRADRIMPKGCDRIFIVNQINLEVVIEYINKMNPEIVVIDSIQVIYHPQITSSPGSVSQVRECANILTQIAKTKGIAIFLIGHVTKEGMLAGPRVLEHVVDTVLYFEGERYSVYRVLRAIKNRFGSTNEIGVFEMTPQGLMEVRNPSEIFLSERPKDSSGSVVVPILEGTRPFLVEIQGLVSRAGFGMVRQKAQGFDPNRLALLVAVLEKKVGLSLQDKDIFLNVAGGVRVMDPAADLGAVIAVATALLDKSVASDTIFLGEVGLSSEVRSVSQITPRINEAQKLGFKRCIVPKNNLKRKGDFKNHKIEVVAVETVKEALNHL